MNWTLNSPTSRSQLGSSSTAPQHSILQLFPCRLFAQYHSNQHKIVGGVGQGWPGTGPSFLPWVGWGVAIGDCGKEVGFIFEEKEMEKASVRNQVTPPVLPLCGLEHFVLSVAVSTTLKFWFRGYLENSTALDTSSDIPVSDIGSPANCLHSRSLVYLIPWNRSWSWAEISFLQFWYQWSEYS